MKFKYNNVDYELLVIHVSGSRLYGNWTEESDWDYRGVVKSTNASKLGLFNNVKMLGGEVGKDKSGEQLYRALKTAGLTLNKTDDIQLYEISNFIGAAIKNNPNIMDTLCYDYNTASTVYISDEGKKLLDNRDLFLSKKLKFTFSGYAMAQLNKIKSHNKWINEFPDTNKVLVNIKKAYDKKDIDFHFISENFGGNVACYITEVDSRIAEKNKDCLSWQDFKIKYEFGFEFDKYQIPRLIDFCTPLDLRGKKLKLKDEISKLKKEPNGNHYMMVTTIRTLLESSGSFRTLGNSMYSLFTEGTGIFGKEGNIKANDPYNTGEWICLIRANPNEYKKNKDHIDHMWEWKINRNKSRGVLEDSFGYDTKHASHLIRLLLSAKKILEFGKYVPELSDDDLKLVQEIRAGKYSYDWVVNLSQQLDNKTTELYDKCSIQHSPDIKKINKLLLDILEV